MGIFSGYVSHGFSNINGYLSEVYCFNERLNSWENDLVPNTNGHKFRHAGITLPDGSVCTIAGQNLDTECFDPIGSWKLNDPIPSPGVNVMAHVVLVMDIPNLSGGFFVSTSAGTS